MPDEGLRNDFTDFPGIFLAFRGGEDLVESTMLVHDAYRVYVNNDYVGNKVLLAQNEKIEDLEKYLKNKGFQNFSTKLVGSEYMIYPEEGDSHNMKNTLQVYLNTK